MKPVKFKEANKCLSKPSYMTNAECGELWVMNDGRQSISLWKMSIKERIKLLFHGNIWLCIMSGHSQPPVWVDCVKTVFSTAPTGDKSDEG